MKLAILSVALLAGCAHNGVEVLYNSDPPGATIYQNGAVLGVTPARLTYAMEPAFAAGGCFNTRPTSVKWASGAEASIAYLTLCAKVGRSQTYTFMRPNVAGREIDMNYALQLRRNEIQEQAARSAALNDAARYFNRPAPAVQTPINCDSYRVGNRVETTCR